MDTVILLITTLIAFLVTNRIFRDMDTRMEVDNNDIFYSDSSDRDQIYSRQNRIEHTYERPPEFRYPYPRRRPPVRFLTNTGSQTDSLFMVGRYLCISGPAAEAAAANRDETDRQIEVIRLLTKQLEKSRKRVAKLEKEIVEKDLELTTQSLQIFALQNTVSLEEHIVEELTDRLRSTKEELSRDRADRETEYETDV